jgi:hypothetical protein
MAVALSTDPVTGPVPRHVFLQLAGLPYGKAAAIIRQYDPHFGRVDGTVKTWNVAFEARLSARIVVQVEAENPEEAEKMAVQKADRLDADDFEVDDIQDMKIISVDYAESEQ